LFVAAKLEEELGASVVTKLTNQMFVAAANNDEANLNSLNAATFVSVVSARSRLACLFGLMCPSACLMRGFVFLPRLSRNRVATN
jgi:hypothetical protein